MSTYTRFPLGSAWCMDTFIIEYCYSRPPGDHFHNVDSQNDYYLLTYISSYRPIKPSGYETILKNQSF